MSNKTLFGLIALAVGLALFLFLSANRPVSPKITFRQTPEIGSEIVMAFPSAITEAKARKSFSISPSTAGELQWLENRRELHFIPSEGFDPQVSYTIRVKRPAILGQIVANSHQYNFQAQKLPTKFNARIPGSQTIYYITESGLKRPIALEVFESYADNKEEDVLLLDRPDLDLYPDNILIRLEHQPDVYKLENGAKRLIQNAETFNTLGLDWNTIAPVNQFEFDSYPTGKTISLSALPHQKVVQGKFIDVNLQSMELTMWENGRVVDKVPVAGTGNPKTSPTRKGFFTILNKEEKHLSSLSGVYMPWSMRYSGDFYLHGWPYWPNGSKLTSKYSSGCVRLFDNDVEKVFQFAEIGTPVLIK